jgi:hypothetical protein
MLMRLMPVISPFVLKPNRRLAASPRGKRTRAASPDLPFEREPADLTA